MRTTAKWFQETNTYTNWPQAPKAHGPFGKDQLSAAERKSLKGVPLFVNVQTRQAIKEAHQLGGRALSYLSFMDTYVHTDGFENGTARAPWDPRKPQMLLMDEAGRFVNTPMDSSWRMWRYLVCNNTREYRDAALRMVREQMERGADGLFIDNSGPRRPCYGHGLPVGYSESLRQVICAIPEWEDAELARQTAPEELYRRGVRPGWRRFDKRVVALPLHRHRFPGKSHDEAYEALLHDVRQVVRSYGRDKVVVINGTHQFTDCADGAMLESYLYSWAWKGPRLAWAKLRAMAEKWRPYVRNGGRVLALSYLGCTARSVAEDALHSFAAAAVSGFVWSDYNTGQDPVAALLRTTRLGRQMTDLAESGSLAFSFYDKGLVVVNGGGRKSVATVRPPASFRAQALLDISDGRKIARADDGFRVAAPANGGRVYLCQ